MAQIAVALLPKRMFLKPQQHSQNQPKSKFKEKISLGYCILNVNYCDLSGNLEGIGIIACSNLRLFVSRVYSTGT